MTTSYRKSWEIVGYTYKADNYTPAGVIERMVRDGEASPAARDMNTEDALDQIASANAIDREDERSFDSDDFPKVIFLDSVVDDELFCTETGDYVNGAEL